MSNNSNLPLLTAVSSLSSLGLASSSVSTPTAAIPTAATPTAAASANSDNEYSTPTTSATAAACFTPTANDEQEWKDFCKSVNVSPPKRINKALGQVKKEANLILQRSCLRRNGSSYTWDSLQDLQQAGMAFIINEGILDCFPRASNKSKRIAHGVLGIDEVVSGKITIHGQAIWQDLHQFVRKGGDRIDLTGDWSKNFSGEKYRQFRSRHKDLWGDAGELKVKSFTSTMFSLNVHVDPVLKFQADYSMVRAFVVCSLMIHYRQAIHPHGSAAASGATASGTSAWSSIAAPVNQGSKQTPRTAIAHKLLSIPGLRRRKARDSSTLRSGPGSPPASSPAHPPVAVLANDNAIETKAGNFSLNIGRYMRQKLTAKQKYETIFEGKGFIFEDVMNGLLRLSNAKAPNGGFLQTINILQHESPEYFCKEVTKQLQHGALCARIRLYEGYGEKTMCVKEREMKFQDSFHFVAITGVSRTHDDLHGGVMFLAQDSLGEPFKNISLELLRAMGATGCLLYIPHNEGIEMPKGSVFDIKPEDIVTAGGLQLKRSEFPRCTDGPMSEEERKERKENRELLEALLNPDYLPEWARDDESNGESGLNGHILK